MKEQEHQTKAFEFYYSLGEGRSYKKVAEEFGVSLGTVKVWGKAFGWKRRVGERDGEVARALADQSLEDMAERVARNRKLVKMGLIRVAKAIAEGKMKVTMADLDRLIRLEDFLRDGDPSERTKFIIEWRDYDSGGKEKDKVCDEDDAGALR